MNFSKLDRSELLGFGAALLLLASLFLHWYGTDTANANSMIDGKHGLLTAFQAFKYIDWLLVAACSAPFILAWIVIRGHDLSWRPGEVTMIVGITALALILLRGVIERPGGPSGTISLQIGWFVGVAAAAALCVAGFRRQAASIKSRRPPGTF